MLVSAIKTEIETVLGETVAELLNLLAQYENTIAEQGKAIAKLMNENFELYNLVKSLMDEYVGET